MRSIIAHLHIQVPLILSLAVFSATQTPSHDTTTAQSANSLRRIAIIGAGAAGSSTAYHLSRYARNASLPISVTVFDKNSYIGGRSTTVPVYDDPYGDQNVELGASIFVPVNRILVDAVKEFGLSTEGFGGGRKKPSPAASHLEEDVASIIDGREGQETADTRNDDEGREVLGVWNGEEFVFTQELGSLKWWQDWWMKGKLLWRYGLAPIRTVNLMKSVTGKFFRMYEEPVFPWKDGLSQAVQDVELLETTALTGEQFLEKNSIGQAFAQEIIQSSTRVNYAQNLGLIHGLETMVCMATDGAMSVAGGNYQIFSNMLNASSADVQLSTEVSKIHRQKDGKYTLSTSEKGRKTATSLYDAVVLAAPYHQSAITFTSSSDNDDEFPFNIPPDVPYVNLHVTLFTSPHRLSPRHFNLTTHPNGKKGSSSSAKQPTVPDVILTTLPESQQADLGGTMDGRNVGKAGFFSLSALRQVENAKQNPPRLEYVYKIFSPEAISDSFLKSLVGRQSPTAIESPHQETDNGGKQKPMNNQDGWPANSSADADLITWVYRHTWKSYPYLPPRVTFDEQKLDEGGLWYTSGIESFISTMETSALMGANIAKLIVEEWSENDEKQNQDIEIETHQDL